MIVFAVVNSKIILSVEYTRFKCIMELGYPGAKSLSLLEALSLSSLALMPSQFSVFVYQPNKAIAFL